MANDVLTALSQRLREDYRLKENVDYAFTLKYDEVTLLCTQVYLERIVEIAAQHGITFTRTFTY
jgi:hypothetical protein